MKLDYDEKENKLIADKHTIRILLYMYNLLLGIITIYLINPEINGIENIIVKFISYVLGISIIGYYVYKAYMYDLNKRDLIDENGKYK